MRHIATDVMWSVSVCVSVSHNRELCKNGSTDRSAHSGYGLGWAQSCVIWGPVIPHEKGHFWGRTWACTEITLQTANDRFRPEPVALDIWFFCDCDTLQNALAKVGYLGMDICFMWSPSRFSHRAILEDRITLHKVVNKHVHTKI